MMIIRRRIHTDAFTWRAPTPIAIPQPRTASLARKQIALKDNILLRTTPTTCSSATLGTFDSPYTATCATRLLNAGAHITGKTSMDEFGMGNANTHLPAGAPRVVNPFPGPGSTPSDDPRVAGGSSGGSAAVVASGQAFAALGTDTGGSVRLPAAYCGIVGLKPGYGIVSRHGVVSYADSLDCVGVLARTVEDVREVFDVISGPDARDATCASVAARKRAHGYQDAARRRIRGLERDRLDGLRIGLPIETHLPAAQTPRHLSPLLTHLRSLGATLHPISIPSIPLSLPAYYVLACAEASSTLARFGGGWYGDQAGERSEARRRGFGGEVRKRVVAGTHALTASAFDNSYLKALHLRHTLRSDYNAIFRSPHPLHASPSPPHGIDLVLHSTAIRTAPLLDPPPTADTTNTYAQDILTVPASLAGLPCVSVPYGTSPDDGWPVGVSLTGQWGMEGLVLDVARVGVESFR
ncbi:hypothetical protein NliqN6_1226 [Naganishia liquefaciens]|uniref:Amidase domain-containing protein n=1 Tax=Naganishia liquefaciens TaxID=104408 RepID=A0A8H3TPX5_9TREE|nr:hypothetical protein NliqN6_1226 [Naganishia liquefaciens]